MARKEREKFPGELVLADTAEKVETIGAKTYYVVKEDDPVWKTFNKGYENSEYYSLCKEAGAKFKIQYVYPMISKKVMARICKAGPNLKIHGELDYVVEISGQAWEMMDDNVREILMAHELSHVDATMDDEGKIKLNLRDHDVEDFLWIIKKYGVQWCELQKSIIQSIEDQLNDEREKKKQEASQRKAGREARRGKKE